MPYRDTTPPTILSLSEPVKKEVSDNHYRQYVRIHGQPITINIPEFHRNSTLKITLRGCTASVCVPLDSVTRQTLSFIESFVKSNVQSEKYKPLYLNDFMCVSLSAWCRFEKINQDGSRTQLEDGTVLGRGTYGLTLSVSHVYVGPHKGGETFSLSLHVTKVSYKPDSDISELISLLESDGQMSMQTEVVPAQLEKTPIPQTPQPLKKKPLLQRRRARRGLDEIDGPKNVSHHLQQQQQQHVL